MAEEQSIVFLFDVDNTLLDNDRVVADLSKYLDKEFGQDSRKRYFEIFEEHRHTLGYADYLGALQRYRVEHPRDPHLLAMSSFLVDYPFANRLFPGSLDAIEHVKQWGKPVIVSDGDVVFQPRKVERSGIFDAVDGHVLIYIHKEQMLDDVASRYPSKHYVLIDDKLRILAATKEIWSTRLTTVFPRQGHYAHDHRSLQSYPPADLTIDRIGELVQFGLSDFLSNQQ